MIAAITSDDIKTAVVILLLLAVFIGSTLRTFDHE